MTQEERIDFLLRYLRGEYADKTPFPEPGNYPQNRALLRELVNVRPPRPISDDYLMVQDAFLREEVLQKGIMKLSHIPHSSADSRISLWQGDITRLEVDAIVNAANSVLLGCFVPGHHCIDNAIHTCAGVQLRHACHDLMQKQGHEEATGGAKITPAYNLPSRYVLHTVGPIVNGALTQQHRNDLAGCYRSCFHLATQQGLESIAFCCISTGVFRFPPRPAAETALVTMRDLLATDETVKHVVFNVFTNDDYKIYTDLIG
jgi:O-acetyl-ADP-ribose deacetylase (regulator of RNase III)